MTDEEWLAQIARAPTPQARLVDADWLLHQNDPRGELVALEEDCRAIDPTADAYWLLKPRRNALRDQTDRGWRKRMGYGAQRASAPSQWPDDVLGRWRMVREIIEVVQGVRLPDAGRSCARGSAIEEKFKVTLGPAVREWVLLVDDLSSDSADWSCVFRDSVSLEPIGRTDAFSLMIQGEGDYHWAVDFNDLGNDDPPVRHLHSRPGAGPLRLGQGSIRTYAGAAHVTDWARAFILGYAETVGPHPRLRHQRG